MVEPLQQPDGELKNPTVKFEGTDASFRGIAMIVLGLLIVGVLVHVIVLKLFFAYRAHEDEVKRSPYPLASAPSENGPSLPSDQPMLEQIQRLKGSESGDFYEREEKNLAQLGSYGDTNDKGYVHIPITQAMRFLVAKGSLKSRQEPLEDDRRRAGGLLDSGGPNSGRLFKEGSK
jgi:hypothetical protein